MAKRALRAMALFPYDKSSVWPRQPVTKLHHWVYNDALTMYLWENNHKYPSDAHFHGWDIKHFDPHWSRSSWHVEDIWKPMKTDHVITLMKEEIYTLHTRWPSSAKSHDITEADIQPGSILHWAIWQTRSAYKEEVPMMNNFFLDSSLIFDALNKKIELQGTFLVISISFNITLAISLAILAVYLCCHRHLFFTSQKKNRFEGGELYSMVQQDGGSNEKKVNAEVPLADDAEPNGQTFEPKIPARIRSQ